MRKLPWVRIVITIIIWICLTIYRNYFMLFDANAVAVGQINNSDIDYAKFQAFKTFAEYYWALYLLPLLMFIPYFLKLKIK